MCVSVSVREREREREGGGRMVFMVDFVNVPAIKVVSCSLSLFGFFFKFQ